MWLESLTPKTLNPNRSEPNSNRYLNATPKLAFLAKKAKFYYKQKMLAIREPNRQKMLTSFVMSSGKGCVPDQSINFLDNRCHI